MFKLPVRFAASSLLLAALLASAAGFAHGQTTLEWIVLAPANEGFSVKLPAKPEEDTDQVLLMGNYYKTRLYTALNEADGILYMVVMQEFPSLSKVLSPAERLDQFMEGFKEGLQESIGTADTKIALQVDRDINLKGHAGRQFKLAFGETRGIVRAFDASPRMYVLLVMGADEKNANAARFFDSFEFKPAPAPAPKSTTETKPPARSGC